MLWKRGNSVLSAQHMKITRDPRIELVDDFNLEIKKVRSQDGGDYVCQISTSVPNDLVHTLEILGKYFIHADDDCIYKRSMAFTILLTSL